MSEITDFYRHYIDVANARDSAAYAACYHPPVTFLAGPRPSERGIGLRPRTFDDMSHVLGAFPSTWSHSTIDSMVEIADTSSLTGVAAAQAAPRPGLIGTCTRWDTDGRAYERVQALYVCTRNDGQLGIKVLVELYLVALDTSRDPSR